MKYKIGDKVVVVDTPGLPTKRSIGRIGVITKFIDGGRYAVLDTHTEYPLLEEELALVTPPSTAKLYDNNRMYFSYTPSDFIWFGSTETKSSQSTKKATLMQKLSSLPQAIRRAFDKDQKALYRAGYIDQNGKWTYKAGDEAIADLREKHLNDNRAEFVTRAEEMIDLEKEEKDDC